MSRYIDLRSDTVTRPTPPMRQAMLEAPLGDDVFGEDPTVNTLQEKVASLLGKEAALFVASGTMANQLAIKAHTQPGDEVIIEASSHAMNFEGGAGAVLSGVQFYGIPGNQGVFDASQVEAAMEAQRTGKVSRKKINTRNILFIVSGAFGGLEDIINKV